LIFLLEVEGRDPFNFSPRGGAEENNQMAGTKAGGLKAAQKNLAKDPNFYAKIGAKGGKNGHTGGFAANPDLARIAGAKGGRISRRGKKADNTAA
jgi:general stress protein YciG